MKMRTLTTPKKTLKKTSNAIPINLMVATRGGRDDMRTCFGIGEPEEPQFTLSAAHEHAVFYCEETFEKDGDR